MKFNFIVILIIITFKLKYAGAPESINLWVVWNIGQGQWVTHILPDKCLHYDMGGEFGSFKIIRKTLLRYCGAKLNKLSLSHWDFDHIFNIPYFARAVPDLCWLNIPEFAHTKKSAKNILDLNIPYCQDDEISMTRWIPSMARNTNESSMVFSEENILTTGDSPIQQEKIWTDEIRNLKFTRVLILGHHGSRTSTGHYLLDHLPRLNFSITSARYLKYKHPHPETLARLALHKIPVLKTEDWGNIWFE